MGNVSGIGGTYASQPHAESKDNCIFSLWTCALPLMIISSWLALVKLANSNPEVQDADLARTRPADDQNYLLGVGLGCVAALLFSIMALTGKIALTVFNTSVVLKK